MKGFLFNGLHAGFKKNGLEDLGVIFSERPASAAALFTRNKVVAAPVLVGRQRIESGVCQAIVVNSGNANCYTGSQGIDDALHTAVLAGNQLNIPKELVMMASTGVIGAPLPMDVMEQALPELTRGMSSQNLELFAKAILTTDTRIKVSSKTCAVKGKSFTVTGIAKGAGMIKPDMATMLAFVLTDLDISSILLKSFLTKACERTLNRISIDGDTSTNDTVIALANGLSHAILEDSNDSLVFQECLNEVMGDLAKMIVKDGEGATKVVRITVKGAATESDALKAADTISQSNLVKTAIYGEDPNWGRIVAAAGRSGADLDPYNMDLFFDDVALVRKGRWLGPDAEKAAARIMKNDELHIQLDLNMGDAADSILFCDFSEDYVRINADYRS